MTINAFEGARRIKLLLRFLFIFALVINLVYAADVTQGQAANQNEPRNAKQQQTRQPPIIVNVVRPPETEDERREKKDEREHRKVVDEDIVKFTGQLANYTFWLFIATLILAIGTIILVVFAWRQSRDTRKTIVLTQRPKLRVRNIVVNRSSSRPHAPELFWNGQLISGQFYVSNIGGTPATIIGSGCWVEWMQHRLPMERPYEDKVANNPIAIGTELAAGGSSVAVFQSDRPMGNEGWAISSCSNGWCIYIMGWIEYIDDIGTKRRTAFCRVLEMPQERFYPVKNEPDYDYEE